MSRSLPSDGSCQSPGDEVASNGDGDTYVAKFDPSGALIWSRGFGGSTFDEARDVAADASGAVYLIGACQLFRTELGREFGGMDRAIGKGAGDRAHRPLRSGQCRGRRLSGTAGSSTGC